MATVLKSIIVDEQQRPVAVQVPYAEWIRIEDELSRHAEGSGLEPQAPRDLSRYCGVISANNEDPLAFQRRIRDEWE